MKFQNDYKDDFAKMKPGRQILKITESEYDEDYGSVSVKMTNKEGAVLYKTFYIENDGEVVESVKRALDFFASKALGHKREYEETDFIGKYIETDVIVDDYQTEKKGKTIYTLDLWNTESASGFAGKKSGSGSGKGKKADDIDLDAELG
jgi:hypothetical protein